MKFIFLGIAALGLGQGLVTENVLQAIVSASLLFYVLMSKE